MPTGDPAAGSGEAAHAASVRPIFVLSLPRSGSTLVQRVLAAHPDVATAPEPWLLLPQAYALREHGALAEYGQVPAARAIREFAQRLPGGEAAYRREVATFATRLYAMASPPSATYFVDKTPRYHLIADELFDLFPDAAFVFLWRNPLAVVASIIETWSSGRWNLERWRSDLFDGPANLVGAYQRHAGRALAVRYEDLVERPEASWPPVFAHLGLAFDPAVLSSFTDVRLDARMGDRAGAGRYRQLTSEPVAKWRATVASPARKRWCRSYLRHLGAEQLAAMGYDLEALLRELDDVPTSIRGTTRDLAASTLSRANARAKETAARRLWRRPPPAAP